ncbi:murein biosynthesis integral membrane protein MurJ [Clostridium sp. D2Q-11]|uniref:Probable lipid II flippase MurJ n=1 Tax=Anaeromonas frigoriresistens TaxID=2683708 RepID=A0A942V2L9_9FIRM|nr:murein biosynthesis integral membrane protein MurJ [Anaeromonas frigoriresistens]MBS4538832.1 murein biosynthesis integral membrane protein MurJ [Anaeromonas frigoriresistens]
MKAINETRKVAKSAILIMMFLLISKFLGFFRDILIASKFGSGMETDAYFVASTACVFFIGIIGNGLSVTLVPIISGTEESSITKNFIYRFKSLGFITISGKGNKIRYNCKTESGSLKNTDNYISNLLNIIILFALVVSLMTWFGAPLLVKVFAKGFKGNQFILAVELTKIGVPMVFFIACSSIFSGLLQGKEKFNTTAAIGIPYNIVFIIFLLFYSERFGIRGLMIASVFAVSSQFLLQAYSVHKLNYSYKPKLNFKDKDIINTLYIIAPVVIGTMVDKINSIVDKTLASELTKGSISALNYSNRLNSLILNVFVIGITTVIYPMLSKEFSNRNIDSAQSILKKGMNIILLIIIPTTVGIMILSTPIIKLLLERGAFDSNATRMTSLALVFYSIGLIGMSLRNIFNKTFYSFKDTKTPMKNGVLTVIINIILNLILVKTMAHVGLALGTSIAEISGALLLLFNLRRKIGGIGLKYYTVYLGKLGISAGVMGIFVYFLNTFLSNIGSSNILSLIFLILTILSGGIIYLVLCYLLKIEEVKLLVKYIKEFILRKRCL